MNYDVLSHIQNILYSNYEKPTYFNLSMCNKKLFSLFHSNIVRMNSLLDAVILNMLLYSHKNLEWFVLSKSLNDLNNAIPKRNINNFISDYTRELISIKSHLSLLINSERNPAIKQDLILIRDQIFLSKLNGIEILETKSHCTKIFNKFMKGITYFAGQNVFNTKQPIYHRNVSCLARDNVNKFQEKDKERVLLCYLERLIYDRIYTEVNKESQNQAHLNELHQNLILFQQYYPDTNIEIDLPEFSFSEHKNVTNPNTVPYKENMIPTKLIIRFWKNDVLLKTEEYIKTYDKSTGKYIYPVMCRKTEGNTIIVKFLYFDSPNTDWFTL